MQEFLLFRSLGRQRRMCWGCLKPSPEMRQFTLWVQFSLRLCSARQGGQKLRGCCLLRGTEDDPSRSAQGRRCCARILFCVPTCSRLTQFGLCSDVCLARTLAEALNVLKVQRLDCFLFSNRFCFFKILCKFLALVLLPELGDSPPHSPPS